MTRVACLAALALLATATPAAADESGALVIRLGRDTVGVERFVRGPGRLEIDQLGRSPRVQRRRFDYQFDGEQLRRFSMVVTPPGATEPTQTLEGAIEGDSLRMRIQTAGQPLRRESVYLPKGAVVVGGTSPWSGYESQTRALARSKADSVRSSIYFFGMPGAVWLSVRRLGRDSVDVLNGRGERFHARIDGEGRILGVKPLEGTALYSVTRVPDLDMDAMAAFFAEEEAQGHGLGALSPRDTLRVADAGGATLWFDYGRPAKRGRVLFGEVVPWGRVWRTGANAATQFRTDHALDFGGVTVPAGFYSLWTLPQPGGWKLIVNRQTGQWGTQHDPEQDLHVVPMTVTALAQGVERFTITVEPRPDGGVLHFDWDTTRASAVFKTRR
jgi:hypothetical protein